MGLLNFLLDGNRKNTFTEALIDVSLTGNKELEPTGNC